MESIILAVLVALVGIIPSMYSKIQEKKRADEATKNLNQAKAELKIQREASDFTRFFTHWNYINQEIESLMRDTCIDRFMLFRAWNGVLEPKWTTAVFQIRRGKQQPTNYVHFELDNDYRSKLRKMVEEKDLYFEVDKIEDSTIKEVYEAEKVTASYWCHLDTKDLKAEGCREMSYCSFATHGETPIPDEVLTRCKIIASRLKIFAEK